MKRKTLTRRRFVATGAAAATGIVAAPFVRGANAAGSLTVGLWDHWVPGANKATEEINRAIKRNLPGLGGIFPRKPRN